MKTKLYQMKVVCCVCGKGMELRDCCKEDKDKISDTYCSTCLEMCIGCEKSESCDDCSAKIKEERKKK